MSDCTEKCNDAYQQRREEIDVKYKNMQKTGFPEVPDMEVTELYNLLTSEARAQSQEQHLVVVDTRQEAEQEVSMIPWGTLREADFGRRRDEFRDFKVVCYCTVGYRSGRYADWLRKQGFDSYNLKGSILAWTHNSFPLVKSYTSVEGSSALARGSSGETRRIHTFTKDWALQGEGYEAEYFNKNLPWFSVAWDSFRLYLPPWAGGATETTATR